MDKSKDTSQDVPHVAQTPHRVAPHLKGVVKNKGIKPIRKPKKSSEKGA